MFSRYHQRESIRLERFQTSELDMKRTFFSWTWFCGCDDDGAGDAAGVVVVGNLAISWENTHGSSRSSRTQHKSKEGDG